MDREREAINHLGTVKEEDSPPAAMEMVGNLVEGHETVIATARAVLHVAEESGDAATADLATRRIDIHEKTAWMLRSMVA